MACLKTSRDRKSHRYPGYRFTIGLDPARRQATGARFFCPPERGQLFSPSPPHGRVFDLLSAESSRADGSAWFVPFSGPSVADGPYLLRADPRKIGLSVVAFCFSDGTGLPFLEELIQ